VLLLGQIKPKFGLVLDLAEDLHKFLEAAGDVVCVGELLELPANLLRLEEGQLRILSHLLVVRVAISMRPDYQVDVMAQSPPDGRSLAVKHARWQKVQ
jgi:hypothetical protein